MMSKYQEAWQTIKFIIRDALFYQNSIATIEKLVNKTIPKKPNKLSEEEGGRFLTNYNHACECGEWVEKSYVCCPYCRQDIDWSEND